MNQALIVTYDLSQPGQNYENLLVLIKEYDSWAKLGGSSYLILTSDAPVEVRDKLNKALDSNDKLFVAKIMSPSAWYGLPEEVSNWIHTNMSS